MLALSLLELLFFIEPIFSKYDKGNSLVGINLESLYFVFRRFVIIKTKDFELNIGPFLLANMKTSNTRLKNHQAPSTYVPTHNNNNNKTWIPWGLRNDTFVPTISLMVSLKDPSFTINNNSPHIH